MECGLYETSPFTLLCTALVWVLFFSFWEIVRVEGEGKSGLMVRARVSKVFCIESVFAGCTGNLYHSFLWIKLSRKKYTVDCTRGCNFYIFRATWFFFFY